MGRCRAIIALLRVHTGAAHLAIYITTWANKRGRSKICQLTPVPTH